MRKILNFCILILSLNFFNSQIRIEIKSQNQIESSRTQVELKIVNETNFRYVIPINTTDFKPYFQEENCMDYEEVSFKETNDSFLRLIFLNSSNGSYVDKIFSNPDPSTLLHSNEKTKKQFEKKKMDAMKSQNNTISQWIKKNNIKQNKEWAEINRAIFSHLIYLEPMQTITYKMYVNPLKLYSLQMNETSTDFYSYYLENNTNYSFFLKYCIDSKVYNYLTEDQKNKLKTYRLFSGSLESNILKWNN